MDQVAHLFERVLCARAAQDDIEERPDQFRRGPQEVDLPGDQIELRKFLALDQYVMGDDERPRFTVEFQLDLTD